MKKDIPHIVGFYYAVQNLILFIYKLGQDSLAANNDKRAFHQYILAQFRPRNPKNNLSHKKESTSPSKKANISRIPSPIPLRPSKKVLTMLKYHKDKEIKQVITQNSQSYTQVSSANIKKIVKFKDMFPNLLTKKIKEVQKVIYEQKKDKPRFNMMMKDPLRRQVLVPMSSMNSNKFMALSSIHITNINWALKAIKLDTMADFIWADQKGLTITTNEAVSMLIVVATTRPVSNSSTNK